MERAVEDYNSAVKKAHMELCAVAEKYNEHIDAANEWMGGVRDDIQAYIDERSEKWHEGDKASAYACWVEEFENEFEHVEFSDPEELDIGDVEQHGETLEQKTEMSFMLLHSTEMEEK